MIGPFERRMLKYGLSGAALALPAFAAVAAGLSWWFSFGHATQVAVGSACGAVGAGLGILVGMVALDQRWLAGRNGLGAWWFYARKALGHERPLRGWAWAWSYFWAHRGWWMPGRRKPNVGPRPRQPHTMEEAVEQLRERTRGRRAA